MLCTYCLLSTRWQPLLQVDDVVTEVFTRAKANQEEKDAYRHEKPVLTWTVTDG
jgi:hypothetical protein